MREESKKHPRRNIPVARNLRQEATLPERLLWSVLRAGKLGGLKFRRQHPLGPFVVDFYCQPAALAVEVDGISHNERAARDRSRTDYLRRSGVHVIRFINDEVLDDLDAVAQAILAVATRSNPSLPPGREP